MGTGQVFAPEARIELIDGDILNMAPIGPPHVGFIVRLNRALVLAVGEHALVSVQSSISLPPDSEPEPDFAVLQPQWQPTALPGAKDTLLVIEVAESSLVYDRDVKTKLYARHGIAETWIVDVQARKLLIYREPRAKSYAVLLERGAGDIVAPVALPEARIDLSTIFA